MSFIIFMSSRGSSPTPRSNELMQDSENRQESYLKALKFSRGSLFIPAVDRLRGTLSSRESKSRKFAGLAIGIATV
jgi:hypothetical protein